MGKDRRKPKPKTDSPRPNPTPKPPTPGFLTIPPFEELWVEMEKNSLELGAKKKDLEVAELCSFGIYNKMMKIIREQLK